MLVGAAAGAAEVQVGAGDDSGGEDGGRDRRRGGALRVLLGPRREQRPPEARDAAVAGVRRSGGLGRSLTPSGGDPGTRLLILYASKVFFSLLFVAN